MKFTFSSKKIGTIIEIIINEDDEKEIEINNNISFLWLFIDDFENEFSRFITDSKLSQLNNNKILSASDRFLDILNKSVSLYRFTNWYFNPLLKLKNIWYSNSFSENNFEILKEDENLDFERVSINWNDIKLLNNQSIDFWWIAKWYLVDLVSSKLVKFWYKRFLVNAWWDLYAKWLNNDYQKWIIWIENPYDGWYIWTIKLINISISTSWSYKRHWQIDWKNYHHIVNPINLENETSLIWISIISSKCYISDSLATAIFSMWMQKWKEFMIKNWIDWILFWKNKDIFLTPNFKEKYSFTEM